MGWESRLVDVSTTTGFAVTLVFGIDGFDNGQVYHLPALQPLLGHTTQILLAMSTKVGHMFYDCIGKSHHLQGAAFVPGLSTALLTRLASQAFCFPIFIL
jgi:hypothetical protein